MSAKSQSVPPKIAAPLSLAFFAVVVLVAAALGSGAILFFFDPTKHGFYPICLFHSLTGWNCPGCGATRAAYQLLHGHLLRALHDNALFVLTLAALAAQGAVAGPEKNPKPAGGVRGAAKSVVGTAGHRAGIHRVAEFAGVRVALTLAFFPRTSGPRSSGDRTFRFCRRGPSCSIVTYESDTSIDDHDL